MSAHNHRNILIYARIYEFKLLAQATVEAFERGELYLVPGNSPVSTNDELASRIIDVALQIQVGRATVLPWGADMIKIVLTGRGVPLKKVDVQRSLRPTNHAQLSTPWQPWDKKMLQRGRKRLDFNVLPLNITKGSPRIIPPPSLGIPARQLFNEIVNSCDHRHFVEFDKSILISYVQVTIYLRQFEKKLPIEKLDRLIRTQANLATKLRLTSQSRVHKDTAGRWAANQHSSFLDKIGDDDDYDH